MRPSFCVASLIRSSSFIAGNSLRLRLERVGQRFSNDARHRVRITASGCFGFDCYGDRVVDFRVDRSLGRRSLCFPCCGHLRTELGVAESIAMAIGSQAHGCIHDIRMCVYPQSAKRCSVPKSYARLTRMTEPLWCFASMPLLSSQTEALSMSVLFCVVLFIDRDLSAPTWLSIFLFLLIDHS